MTAPAPIRVPVDDGVELSVLAWSLDGPAAPVALVHGLASNARLWDGVAPELAARGHPVVALDQRGHGLSSKPSGGYDFARLSLDLLEVFSRLGWSGERAPVVAGQSWGGNVALDLAAHHPRSLSGLVLVDGGTIELSPRFADWPTCEAALAPPPLAGTPFEDFERLVRAAHPGWPEAGIQGTLANVERRPDGTIAPRLPRELHMQILRHLWEHRPGDLYPRVGVPVVMIMAVHGSQPRWMAGRRAEVAAASAALARSEVHWTPGDHDLHAQYPEKVAGLISSVVA